MAGQIIFYNSRLSVFSGAYLSAHGGHSYISREGIIGILHEKADDSRIYSRIEILDHGGPGMASIGTSQTVASSTGTISHDPGMLSFWMTLRQYMGRTSCLVLNMCNAGKFDEGRILLREIQRLSGGIVYGAITDMTSEVGMHYFNDPTKYRHYMH
ncbi:MAG: hypothetical protein ACREJ6_05015 [Candidatus Methylomirabilis sp.]